MTDHERTAAHARLAAKNAEISAQAAEIDRLGKIIQTEREINEDRIQGMAEELNERR
jgi:hypothetical protein